MTPLLVSDKAEQDLEDHWFYLARHNIGAANRFLLAVQKAFGLIRSHPEIGWQKPFSNLRLHGIRMLPVTRFRNYLLFYRDADRVLEIVRVLHGTRDLERQLDL